MLLQQLVTRASRLTTQCYTFDMLRVLTINLIVVLASTTSLAATPPVEVELATEQGLQITAPHEWLQLLANLGIEHVQIRGIRWGDEPRLENRGTASQPNYHLVGVITAREQLRLPGGTYSRGDRAMLKDYFERLSADGAEAMTAPHGRFGLTEKEINTVFADLTPAIDFETKGQPPRAILDRLQAKLSGKTQVDGAANQVVESASPFADDLKRVSRGTGLAIVLRNYGLAFRPDKPRGAPVVYRIEVMDPAIIGASTLGKPGKPIATDKYWPIGWEPDKPPGELAPSLFESLSAEIDGYSLAEAIAAIEPRLKLPLYKDHLALAADKIEPTKLQVKLARAKFSYKRLLDRVLAQAHLGASLRIDESGAPFLWVVR